MAHRFVLVSLLALLVSSCGAHPDIVSDDIDSIWLKTFEDEDLSTKVIVDESEWREVIREIRRCRQSIGKYYPEATLVIEYKNGSKNQFNLLSRPDKLVTGRGDSPYSSNRKHPVLEKYLDLSNAEYISWPYKTTGPNLPVRNCDIDRWDEDTTVIGYAFVDTAAVNWMLPNLMKDSYVFTPDIFDLRKAERILKREYPTILRKIAYDKDGHLFEEGGLSNYARQYLFMESPEGSFVYINFVYLRSADLEDKEPPVYDPDDPDFVPPPPSGHALSRYWVIVHDGGDSYWRVFLNLDREKIEWCGVNGHA